MWDAIIMTPFINVILLIYMVVKNFGITIILFTILIRLITHPLTVQQLKGTSAMQDLQKDKRWIEIQKKYKDDKEQLNKEQLALYKELGINPFASCLPLLIQFPIMIGLYQTITRALAGTPMDLFTLQAHIYPGLLKFSALIPIEQKFLWFDLAQPERLLLPFLSFGIPILAILVVASTYVQSKVMTPPSADPNDQSASMARSMNLMMPLFMGWISYTLSSGLATYFLVSNVLGVVQYAMLGKVNWRNLLPGSKPAGNAEKSIASSKPASSQQLSTSKSGKKK
jgi:YidC/Oxa1 family membrane protein insertase